MIFSLSSTGGEGRGEEAIGIWLLELFWDLEFGIWSFPRLVHGKRNLYAKAKTNFNGRGGIAYRRLHLVALLPFCFS